MKERMPLLLMINSKLDRISHRFGDVASFPWKNAHFFYPRHSNPNLKMFPLHCIAKNCVPEFNAHGQLLV